MPTRILIVDDDAALRDVLTALLHEEGFAVVTLAAPPADLTIVRHLQPDLVLLDCLFHGAPHGLELLARLQADPTTRGIPILLSSASPTLLSGVAPARHAAGIHTLPRPFQAEALFAAVRQALQRTDAAAGVVRG